jgi:hypothetical protein
VTDVISLSLPARADLLILPRLVVAAIGARAGFNIDEIEDLRLAIDELCVSVIGEEEGDGELSLELVRSPGCVEVTCRYAAGAAGGAGDPVTGPADLASRILEALVDEHAFKDEGGTRTAWLKKSALAART